ncbi:glycosyltransferase family 2 protein [Persicitalea jodogahamensis]|uniref:Glycosyltransferase 2-like domain-containing protein n=1 Tax=Persicitalea jodogahamensis TaxID=402147 RepID=A0A8J3D2T4_9BACT|nr:glycosyltransferase [Persicitalea jodogahamensis]GHB62941.1 hypothetical protein GCM10007390_15970 [Persicitalea jodogahamensis]
METIGPQISIITPVWNGMPFIVECISSILNQKLQNWELLISDDGSTDESRQYLKEISDKRIKVYFQKSNLGIFGNLNFLFSKSTAPFSQILCQDDYFNTTNALDLILEYWRTAQNNIGFVRFNHCPSNVKGLIGFESTVLPKIITNSNSDLFFYVFGNIPGNLSNISARTGIIKNCGWFNPSIPYAGDFEFWIRACKLYHFGLVSENITFIRRHSDAASNFLNKNGELISQRFPIINRLYNNIISDSSLFIFKLHGTLCYYCAEKDTGLKCLVNGNVNYLKSLSKNTKTVSFLFPKFLRIFIFIISIGGRVGRVYTAKNLIKYYLK